MVQTINLQEYFSEQALRVAYCKYKRGKTDRFSGEIEIQMGADGVTWEAFENNLESNLANISRRVLNGSYYFYPMLDFEKPKPGSDPRTLSISCIRDAIVQRQLYAALYESAEDIFESLNIDVSFAYRKGKSGPAVASRIWYSFKNGFEWAFDADITKFFDTLDHTRLKALVDEWIGQDSIAGKLVWRFIRTDHVPAGSYDKNYFKKHKPERKHLKQPTKGIPQGGVLSGMLANLYLHEFDRWVVQELSLQCELRYYRYADDFVILTRSKENAEALDEPVDEKLHGRDMKLALNPGKTESAVEIATGKLEFVGFRFLEDRIQVRQTTVDRFKKRFNKVIRKTLTRNDTSPGLLEEHRRLVSRINRKIRGPDIEICESCRLPKEPSRNWMSYFANTVTDVRQIKNLDHWLRTRISIELHKKYAHSPHHQRLEKKHWRLAKAVTLESEYYRQRRFRKRFRGKLCECSNDSHHSTKNIETCQD